MTGEELKLYQRINKVTNRALANESNVSERTIQNWRRSITPIPAEVSEAIKQGNSTIINISHEQLCTTVYKLIQNMKEMELELTALRRERDGMGNRYYGELNLYTRKKE